MVDLTKEQEEQYNKIMSKVNLSKDKEAISEHVVNLSKCMVNLSKHNDIDLGGQVARVITALDYSGSMRELYEDGTIQQTLNKLMPIGLSFDDNGEIEMHLFSDNDTVMPVLTLENYSSYKTEIIDKANMAMMGTEYSPVIKNILDDTDKLDVIKRNKSIFRKIIGNKKDDGETVFIIFITDGEPSDKEKAREIVRKSSYANVFIQFIGIGDNKFRFLNSLDTMTTGKVNNTGFTNMGDLRSVGDETLYNTVLSDFSRWLKERESK